VPGLPAESASRLTGCPGTGVADPGCTAPRVPAGLPHPPHPPRLPRLPRPPGPPRPPRPALTLPDILTEPDRTAGRGRQLITGGKDHDGNASTPPRPMAEPGPGRHGGRTPQESSPDSLCYYAYRDFPL
jgi:hypothetical protein